MESCAVCSYRHTLCTADCIFLDAFPGDRQQDFQLVHNFFSMDRLARMLQRLTPAQRRQAGISLIYEATARIEDPVEGSFGTNCDLIIQLQHQSLQWQNENQYLMNATNQLQSTNDEFMNQIQKLQKEKVDWERERNRLQYQNRRLRNRLEERNPNNKDLRLLVQNRNTVPVWNMKQNIDPKPNQDVNTDPFTEDQGKSKGR